MVKVMAVEAGDGDGRRQGDGGEKVEFHDLPEGCIANIISFTTPRDAGILSLVSSTFRSAAQSDVVWERFLPSDYQAIISQSSAPPACSSFASKKDFYLHLCRKPLFIDAGKKSFLLDKLSGKKCYMLSARILFIVWGDTPTYWKWTSVPDARFSEVAELVSVCWFEIRGWTKTCMLSPETLYGAYLVFKPGAGGSYGFQFQPVEVCVGIAGDGDGARRRTVCLDAATTWRPRHQNQNQIVHRRGGIFNFTRSRLLSSFEAQAPAPPPPSPSPPSSSRLGIGFPKERGDGWWEIELGDFFNRRGDDDKELEMGVYEVKSGDWKGGILIQGIELRPKPI